MKISLVRNRVLSIILVFALVFAYMTIDYSPKAHAAAPNPVITDVSYGVNFLELYSPSNFIYLGQHKHAKQLTDRDPVDPPQTMPVHGAVKEIEGQATPILWRVMGEEVTGELTLMSQYVIDSRAYGGPGGRGSWAVSALNLWLNDNTTGGFLKGFPGSEKNLMKTGFTVETKGITISGGVPVFFGLDSTTLGQNTAVYLPWGSGNDAGASFPAKDTVWWNRTNPTIASDLNSANYMAEYQIGNTTTREAKTAYLKPSPEYLSNSAQTVWYWTRTPNGNLGEVATVDTKGINNNSRVSGNLTGVRPIMVATGLEDRVVMALTVVEQPERADEIKEVITATTNIYMDHERVDPGWQGKAFKLVVLDNDLNLKMPANLTYHYDEQLPTTTTTTWETLYVNQGKSVKIESGLTPVADQSLAYKIVDSTGTLVHYGTGTDLSSVQVAARNLAMTGDLPEDTYHAYVWVQKNNEYASHEASTPLHFELKVVDIGLPTIPVGQANRVAGGNTAISFDIGGMVAQTGDYYYLVNPASVPSSIEDFIADTNTTKASYTIATGTISEKISLSQNVPVANGNKVYVIAKNMAGEVSPVKEITIADGLPNNPPVAKPNITQQFTAGTSVSFDATDVGTDPDGDVITITSINTGGTNASLVNVTLTGGVVTLDGLAAGTTSVAVIVADSKGATVSITVPITVDPAPPTQDPSVTPTSVSMKVGESKTASIQMGLGTSGAASAAITSGDASIATVNPATLSANGTVTITGVKKGTTQIQIAWNNGSSAVVAVTVTEDGGTLPPDPPDPPVTTQFTVNYSGGTGGTVSSGDVSSGGKVDKDKVIKITATPNSNYKFSGWTVNGVSGGAANPENFTITKDTTIVAAFTSTGTIPWRPGGNGGSSGSGSSGGGGGGGGRIDGATTGSSSTSKGSGQGSGVSYLPNPFVVDVPRANAALSTMNKNKVGYSRVVYNGAIKVLGAASKTFNTTPVYYDVVIGNAVQVRVTVPAPHLMTEDMFTSGYVKGAAVDRVHKLFTKGFKNELFVIHFDQLGLWGQTVQVAALIDFASTPTTNLYFYYYNSQTNKFTRMDSPNYRIDSNGYLRFETIYAGDIIVANGPLAAK